MTKGKNGLVVAALAATLAGAGLTIPAAPAVAQGSDRLEMFGPGERGWFEGRPEVFGEGRRGWFENEDRMVREQYERGYRMGREDERRASGQQAMREYAAALEYLDMARERIAEGELRGAWVVLGRAETRLLTRAASGSGDEQAATGGAVGAIRDARRALQDRQPGVARERVARAEALIERGRVIGATTSGRYLSGAGTPGPGQPLGDGRYGGSSDWRSGGGRN